MSEKIVIERLDVRSWQPSDQDAVRDLFEGGRLAGQVAANDTAADIEIIPEIYQSRAKPEAGAPTE